ncbi:hypothetical protein [Streptomyces sp. NPDC004685]
MAGYLCFTHSESAGVPRADDTDVQRVWTAACLYGLRAALCDDADTLDDYLPSHIAQLAKQVATVLGTFQPPAV